MKRKKKNIDNIVYQPTEIDQQDRTILNRMEKDIDSIDLTKFEGENESVEKVNQSMFMQIIQIIKYHMALDKQYTFVCGTKKDMSLSCVFDENTVKIYYDNTYIAALFDFFYIFWTYLFKEDLVLDSEEELMYRNALNGSLFHFFINKTEKEPNGSIKIKLNEEILGFTNMTIRSIEIFLFLHEIGHSLEGQLFAKDLTDIDKEFICDRFALDWLHYLYVENVKVVDIHMKNNITAISPLLILLLLDYVDKMKIKNGLKVTTDMYHPTYKNRLDQIKIQINEYLSDIQWQIVDQFAKLLNLMDELI